MACMSNEARPPWLFDEYRGHRFIDASEVEAYERASKRDLIAERELLRGLGLASQHTLIDFGAGSGTWALEAATLCERVIAVDPSAAMLDYMRSKAESRGISNVEYVQCGFLTYEHAGALADFAVTRHALHLLPDFWKVEALRRVYASLKPGGTFYAQELVYSFEPGDASAAIERWLDTVQPESAGGFPRSFFEEHVREKYSTYSWLFEAMLRKVGFEIRDATYSPVQAYGLVHVREAQR
jgi:ubiquinone/menaquinone biosynthesis C-methylase UbiE